ncbi:MAG: hypothetical protein CMN28_05810 [Salinisphaeraceae bacterium]|nr:hypothetical protein [Salinisphaeraceae bacterium]
MRLNVLKPATRRKPTDRDGQPDTFVAPQGFPALTLMLSVLLTLACCFGIAAYTWLAFDRLQTSTFDLVELETLRGRISHKNETLELSARMAAATGEEFWLTRYGQIQPQLERALTDAEQTAASPGIELAVQAARNAIRLRQTLDAEAFQLMATGDSDAAYRLLTGAEYADARRLFQQVETALLGAIRRDLDSWNNDSTRHLSMALVLGLALPCVLILMWWLATRRVNTWQRRVAHHAQRRAAAEQKLQTLNSELGRRVEARARQLRESEQRLTTLVNSAPVMLFSLDRRGRITLSEGAGRRSDDFQLNRKLGRNIFDEYGGNRHFCAAVRRALSGEDMDGVFRLEHSVFEIRLTPVVDQHGDVSSIIGVATDVSGRHEAEQRARLLATAVEQNPAGVAIMDKSGTITYVNERATELIGKSSGELVGRDWRTLRTREVSSRQTSKLRQVLAEGESWGSEFRMMREDGQSVWLRARLSPIAGGDGRHEHYLYTIEDISDTKQYQQSLDHQRHYDGLTGLPNRALVEKRIDSLNDELQASGRRPAAVLLLDLDDFKKINELTDHRVGDELLVEAARRISGCVRASETVARTGGDEFLIVLSRFDEIGYVEQVAQRILHDLRQRFEIAGREYFISGSVGIAMSPSDGLTSRELVRKAETAMYQAKSAGRNTYRYFHPEMNVGAQRRMLIDAQLHRAIERREMSLHYQPIIEIGSGEVVAAEALLRWNNAVLGQIGPDEFIPVAEAGSLIHEIGAWVMEQACLQAVAWRDLPGRERPLKIAVNASSKQFAEPRFAGDMLAILEKTGASSQDISLEVTESLMIENPPVVAENLNRLAAHSIEISVDDFGTGYSSLGYLKHYSFSTLKIDRLFVRDVIEDSNDAELAAGIIALGHGLHMKVTGEGVESPAQLRFLQSKGCDQAQGNLFSKPMKATDFEQWATRQALRMNEFLTGGVGPQPRKH